MKPYKEIIQLGQLELRFLLDGEDTNQQMVMFELLIPPGAKVPVPHYHVEVDEAVYGLEGVLTSIVNGQTIETLPGESFYIPRGDVHYHANLGTENVNTLFVLTPASIGPQYFRDLRALMQAGMPPDPAKVVEIMGKHGLIPA